ncbi:MAG: hypothetical protein K2K02_01540 [Ruminococcus sp.]|nr:hypothetical protein [Ruminococcus sp.]
MKGKIYICPQCSAKLNISGIHSPVHQLDYGMLFPDSMAFALECDKCGYMTKWYSTPEEADTEWQKNE